MMTSDLWLRGKWTFRTRVNSQDQQIVLIKNANEKSSHVFMKAFLWSLYLPKYPNLNVEVRIGDRFKPDLVSLDDQGTPMFWGESGQVGRRKIQSLLRRFRKTHFAFAKWGGSLRPHVKIFDPIIKETRHHAPVELLIFPEGSADEFIDENGSISVRFEDLLMKRWNYDS